MKNYSCRVFKYVDDLLNWLNKEQEYINVLSIMYVDSSFHYEVIFYTEEKVIENKEIEEKEIVTYQYKQNNDGYRSTTLPYSKTVYW
jgi:hypothetical protein